VTSLKRLSAYEVRVPLPRTLNLGAMIIRDREYVIVEAESEAGNCGYSIGFTRGAPIRATIERLLKPRWEGINLEDYPLIYQSTSRSNRFLGTHGVYWRAVSAADCAIHDLLAKEAGLPLCVYLGGQITPVEVTLAGCYPTNDETPESLQQQMEMMEQYRAAGIKLTSATDYARDTERLRIARSALQSGTPLLIDLYAQVDHVADILPYALRWAEYDLLWVEDPFWFDNFDDLHELARALPYPVGVGDEQGGIDHYRNLMRYGNPGVLRLDVTACGGITAFRSITQMAFERGIPISTHVFHHLHAHLAAAIPGVKWIEYMLPQAGIDGLSALIRNDLQWSSGRIVPDDAPGVHYEWNTEMLERYRL
jgi:L-alanine-DL-glutamate epimerase-like enolase superfamily enzyme